jgi:hypothetical protein
VQLFSRASPPSIPKPTQENKFLIIKRNDKDYFPSRVDLHDPGIMTMPVSCIDQGQVCAAACFQSFSH